MLTSREAEEIRQNGGRVRTLFYDCQTCKRSYKTTVPATRWNKGTSRVAMKECSQCDAKSVSPCAHCPEPSVTNLDGVNLCQHHASLWAQGEKVANNATTY